MLPILENLLYNKKHVIMFECNSINISASKPQG